MAMLSFWASRSGILRIDTCRAIIISMCKITSCKATIGCPHVPRLMALRKREKEIPLIYPTRSFTPLSGSILDSQSIRTYVGSVKFYGSGCLERFLDYTHLKKISHESLQRRRVFTRRLDFSEVSVNIPYLQAFRDLLSGVVEAKKPFPWAVRSAWL